MTERLPQNYLPTHYELFLHYLKDPSPFKARVTITFQKKDGGDQVYLNIHKNITINKIIQNDNELSYTVDYPKLIINRSDDPNFDFTSSPITIKYTVKPSTKKKVGFFACETSYLTDFEPNGARHLLPCFDEPFVRATFSVIIRIPSELTGISNMPSYKKVSITDTEKKIYFSTTPPMSCYLLCICVGKFDYLSGATNRGIPVIFYYDSGPLQLDPEYLRAAIFSLEWMEEHFNIKYALPHLQLITVKGFKYGMENYGLITLLEYPVKIDFNCERVIMHEVAHQWFGDLVSIEYWDSLWLNEGFARYLDSLIYNDFDNGDQKADFFRYRIAYQCIPYFTEGVISPPPNDIVVNFDNLFGQLVYNKGSFVVKMFHDLIGSSQFYKICSKWLDDFKNKSASIDDFVSLVNSELNSDYTDFFDCWLRKTSFPVVMVDFINHDEETGKFKGVTIKQVNPNSVLYQFSTSVTYRIGNEIKKDRVVVKEMMTKIEQIEYDWITVNNDFGTLLYVLYSKEILKAMRNWSREDDFRFENLDVIANSVIQNPVPELIDDEMKELVQMGSHQVWK